MWLCCSLLFVTQSGVGTLTPKPFQSANEFHIDTPTINESYGHYLAVQLLEEVLEVFHSSITDKDSNNLPIFVMGDNIPMISDLHTDSN